MRGQTAATNAHPPLTRKNAASYWNNGVSYHAGQQVGGVAETGGAAAATARPAVWQALGRFDPVDSGGPTPYKNRTSRNKK